MRIAIPLAGGHLSQHFGHCEQFAFFDVDAASCKVAARHEAAAPDHQPGLLPRWLKDQGVTVVIAGGIGERAQALFTAVSIEVIAGVAGGDPESLVEQYLAGSLASRPTSCNHSGCH